MNEHEIRQRLRGVLAMTLTPFDDDDKLDRSAVEGNVNHLVGGGIRALIVGGHVGELFALSFSEATKLMEWTAASVDLDDVLVIMGASYAIDDAIETARRASDAGVHAIMVHDPPHPHATTEGLLQYYGSIASRSPIPIVPYLSRPWLSVDDISRLSEELGLVGVKAAIKDLPSFSRVVQNCPSTVWICGLAERWAPFYYAAGAQGFTSGIVNISTARSLELHATLEGGDWAAAMAIWADLEGLELLRAGANGGFNAAVLKEAVRQVGRPAGNVRPPATPLPPGERSQVTSILQGWGLIA